MIETKYIEQAISIAQEEGMNLTIEETITWARRLKHYAEDDWLQASKSAMDDIESKKHLSINL